MKQIEGAKEIYDRIPIPAELSERIQEEVNKAARKRRRAAEIRRIRNGLTAAAAAAAVFVTALNTNTVFAENASKVPVIGSIAKVLTFRSYETETEDLKITVDIPSVEMIREDLKGTEEAVNEEIHRLCQEYGDEAVLRAREYRQAFLDTGGTEEEWAAHNIEIRVWYEIKAQTDRYLSLAVMGTESWTSAYSETRYYNFDLNTGKLLTLQDLLGENYRETADRCIRSRMEEQMETGEGVYWPDEFKGVDENTKFYVNESGNPVIVFEKYEIAPGSEGSPEFEIPREGERAG